MRNGGFELHPLALAPPAQAALLAELQAGFALAPPIRQITPWGKPMSVQQTSFGSLGWTSDRKGYRYEPLQPATGLPWPEMPAVLLELWARYAGWPAPPDSCLVNIYGPEAKMGQHRDADEADLEAPVLSVSLGDSAVFRLGGRERGDPTTTVKLNSGDVCLLKGEARQAYHGIDRVLIGSSGLVPGGGRINLTLRRAGA
jgi:alkylated DNA repair protein (DNA oxidative demethylase)